MALLRPPSRLRLAVAILVIGAALAGATILHLAESGSAMCGFRGLVPAHTLGRCLHLPRPPWVDPVALGILILGILVCAAVLLMAGRRLPRPSGPISAAFLLGVALLGAGVLYVVGDPGGHVDCKTNFIAVDQGHECLHPMRVLGPSWVAPAILGIVVLGIVGARDALRTARRRHS